MVLIEVEKVMVAMIGGLEVFSLKGIYYYRGYLITPSLCTNNLSKDIKNAHNQEE